MDEILEKLERGDFDHPNQKAHLFFKVKQYIKHLENEKELLQVEVKDTYETSQTIIYELNEANQKLIVNKNLAQALAVKFQKENEKLTELQSLLLAKMGQ